MSEAVPIRRGDVVLAIDRSVASFPACLFEGGLRVRCLSVTSVTPDTFRGRFVEGGAKLYDRQDVIAARPSVDEAKALFDQLCAIGKAARADIKASRETITVNALAQVEAALCADR